MKKIYITRRIPEIGIKMLQEKGFELDINPKDRPLTQKELIKALTKKPYDGVLSLLTDTIDAKVFDAAPTTKIFANYAVGFNNIDVTEAKKRGITITNTPGGLTESVAEHTFALILALSCRIVEGDAFIRKGKYNGWDPLLLLGTDLIGKTLGVLGTGRIGADVVRKAVAGFRMKTIYYDVVRNEALEKEFGAMFLENPDDVFRQADVISVHVPLMDSTRHLVNAERLALMKPTAYLVNTSRGPVIDEAALVSALVGKQLAGAGLDVFEFEPKLAKGLSKLPNVVLTPHIASGTRSARDEMAHMAADNLIAFFDGKTPPNIVK